MKALQYPFAMVNGRLTYAINFLNTEDTALCVECGKEMVAKQGKTNRWHFCHKTLSECGYRPENEEAIKRPKIQTITVSGYSESYVDHLYIPNYNELLGCAIDFIDGRTAKVLSYREEAYKKRGIKVAWVCGTAQFDEVFIPDRQDKRGALMFNIRKYGGYHLFDSQMLWSCRTQNGIIFWNGLEGVRRIDDTSKVFYKVCLDDFKKEFGL